MWLWWLATNITGWYSGMSDSVLSPIIAGLAKKWIMGRIGNSLNSMRIVWAGVRRAQSVLNELPVFDSLGSGSIPLGVEGER